MERETKCPVANCKHKCKSFDLVFHHLMRVHNKSEIAATVVVLMDLAADLKEKLQNIAGRHKAYV